MPAEAIIVLQFSFCQVFNVMHKDEIIFLPKLQGHFNACIPVPLPGNDIMISFYQQEINMREIIPPF